jgi:uncharacterized iron-regulated membrane protein
VIAAARAVAPEGAVPQRYMPPSGHHEPASVRFTVPQSPAAPRGFVQIFVDPDGTAHTGPRAAGWERMVHDLHGSFMSGQSGRTVVGIVGIVMAGLSISGLILWWPARGQWRSAFTVSTKGSVRKILRDLHGATGIWGLIVFVIVTVSGIVLSFPAARPGQGGGPRAAAPLESYRADAAVALARATETGTVVRSVTFPRTATDTYKVELAAEADDRNTLPATVLVNEAATQVVETRPPVAVTDDFRTFMRALHTGRVPGWIWWSLVLASGVLPVIFAVSGISLWLVKRRNRARVAAQ